MIKVGGTFASALPAEVNLVHLLLDTTYENTKNLCLLVYSKAANSDPLRYSLTLEN
ncbi:hypothetical protein FIU95_20205 [Microbulbifer sp. THAF38]|nr:hypothetical protein FIU95_20205 [Microbulbifer sp. THAF38]